MISARLGSCDRNTLTHTSTPEEATAMLVNSRPGLVDAIRAVSSGGSCPIPAAFRAVTKFDAVCEYIHDVLEAHFNKTSSCTACPFTLECFPGPCDSEGAVRIAIYECISRMASSHPHAFILAGAVVRVLEGDQFYIGFSEAAVELLVQAARELDPGYEGRGFDRPGGFKFQPLPVASFQCTSFGGYCSIGCAACPYEKATLALAKISPVNEIRDLVLFVDDFDRDRALARDTRDHPRIRYVLHRILDDLRRDLAKSRTTEWNLVAWCWLARTFGAALLALGQHVAPLRFIDFGTLVACVSAKGLLEIDTDAEDDLEMLLRAVRLSDGPAFSPQPLCLPANPPGPVSVAGGRKRRFVDQ